MMFGKHATVDDYVAKQDETTVQAEEHTHTLIHAHSHTLPTYLRHGKGAARYRVL